MGKNKTAYMVLDKVYFHRGRTYRPDPDGNPVAVPVSLARTLERQGLGRRSATPLPADFPARDALVTAGLGTAEAVRTASDADLTQVEGIGPATLKTIRGWEQEVAPPVAEAEDDIGWEDDAAMHAYYGDEEDKDDE